MLVNVRTISIDQRRERREITARMKTRLAGDFDARTPEEWHVGDKGHVKAELARDIGLPLKPVGLLLEVRRQGGKFVARHPLPRAVDRFIDDDGIDLRQRGESGSPYGLSMVAPEIVHEADEVAIGNSGDVSTRVPCIDAADPVPVDDRDAFSRTLQQVCRGQAGDAAADDRHVDAQIAFECCKPGHVRRVVPVRLDVELSRRMFCHAELPCKFFVQAAAEMRGRLPMGQGSNQLATRSNG